MAQSKTRDLALLSLLALLTGQASAVTLKNFEGLSKDLKVSSSCEAAYYTPLKQCIFEDFMGGAACSTKCKASIGQVAAGIQHYCADVQADPDSLMYRGQQNQLVEILCRDQAEEPSAAPTSTTTTSSSTTFSTAAKTAVPSGGGETPKFIVVEPASSSTAAAAEPKASKASASTSSKTEKSEPTQEPETNGGGGDPFGGNSTPSGNSGHRQIDFWGYGSLAISGIACVLILA